MTEGIAAEEVELAYGAVRGQRLSRTYSDEAMFRLDLAINFRKPDGSPYIRDVERSVDYQRASFFEAMSARLHLFALLDAKHRS